MILLKKQIKEVLMGNNKINSIQELLKIYLESDISPENLVKQISFKLVYKDPVLKGELTTPYIEMLTEYQESVYYAFLAITGRTENLNYLTFAPKTK